MGVGRRSDLQAIRGFAVAAVVIFHFFPKILPRGYLGVDAFFVLSGYLISMILSREDPLRPSTYADFYYRRVKRIFPLFLLIVFFCLLYVVTSTSSSALFYNTKSAYKALLFITNIVTRSEEEDYFRRMIMQNDIFTHTWSLSVEIQFYMLAPLILLPGKVLLGGRLLLYCLLLVCLSSLYLHVSLSPSSAFYSTFARIWQFMMGAIVFHSEQQEWCPLLNGEEEEEQSKSSNRGATTSESIMLVLLCVLLIVLLHLTKHNETTSRFAVTVFVAMTVWACTSSFLFTHPSIVYIGDISYTLYLVHWPVLCGLTTLTAPSTLDRIVAIGVCVVISCVIHEYYEKPYLSLSPSPIAAIIFIFYFLSFLLLFLTPNSYLYVFKVEKHQYIDTFIDWEHEEHRNVSKDEYIRINDEYDLNWIETLDLPECGMETDEFDYKTVDCPLGYGQYDFLIVGNSYAPNQAVLLIKHLKYHYRHLRLFYRFSCEAIFNTLQSEECEGARDRYLEEVKKMRPDVLFIIQRTINPSFAHKKFETEDIIRDISEFARLVNRTFILNALPRVILMKNHGNGEITSKVTEEATGARAALALVPQFCPNCVVYDLYNCHLDQNRTYQVVHPHTHIQYLDMSEHYTPYGFKLIEPAYEKMDNYFDVLMHSNHTFNGC